MESVAAGGGRRVEARTVFIVLLVLAAGCGAARDDSDTPSAASAGAAGAGGSGANAGSSAGGSGAEPSAGRAGASVGGSGGSDVAGAPGGETMAGANGGGAGAADADAGGAGGSTSLPDCREASIESSSYLICGNAGLAHASARALCQDNGGELLKLDSAAEEQAIYEAVTERGSIWLGANDIEQEGDWRWADGSVVSNGYTGWVLGQPNDSGGGEDCAVLHSGMGEWNDVACDVTSFDEAPMTIVCELR